MARSIDVPGTAREEVAVPVQDRSLGDLFSELTHEMTTLVRQEVSLAKTEMSKKAADVGKDIAFLAAGGALAYAGLLAIIAAIIIGVAHVLPWWLSALLVGVVVAAIGGFLVWKGIDNLKQVELAPTTTLDTLKEDKAWAQDQAI